MLKVMETIELLAYREGLRLVNCREVLYTG